MCDKGFLSRSIIPGHRTLFIYQIHPLPDWARPTRQGVSVCFYKKWKLVWRGFKNNACIPILSCPGMDMWSKDKIFNDSGLFLLGFQRDHQQRLLCGSQSQGPALRQQWLVSGQPKEKVEGTFIYMPGDQCRLTSLCCHGANAVEHIGWCVSDPCLPQVLPPLVIIFVWAL